VVHVSGPVLAGAPAALPEYRAARVPGSKESATLTLGASGTLSARQVELPLESRRGLTVAGGHFWHCGMRYRANQICLSSFEGPLFRQKLESRGHKKSQMMGHSGRWENLLYPALTARSGDGANPGATLSPRATRRSAI